MKNIGKYNLQVAGWQNDLHYRNPIEIKYSFYTVYYGSTTSPDQSREANQVAAMRRAPYNDQHPPVSS